MWKESIIPLIGLPFLRYPQGALAGVPG